MGTDNSTFNLIDFIYRRVEDLSNSGCLDSLLFAEFHKFPTLTFNKEHIVNPVDAAHLWDKLDIQVVDSIRKSEVNACQAPLSRDILDFTETVIQRLGPDLAVFRDTDLEVGFDKGIGCALRIALRSEAETQILCGNRNIAYGQIGRGRAEENVVLSGTVIE